MVDGKQQKHVQSLKLSRIGQDSSSMKETGSAERVFDTASPKKKQKLYLQLAEFRRSFWETPPFKKRGVVLARSPFKCRPSIDGCRMTVVKLRQFEVVSSTLCRPVVSLNKEICATLSLSTQKYKCARRHISGGDPAMDWHPVRGGGGGVVAMLSVALGY